MAGAAKRLVESESAIEGTLAATNVIRWQERTRFLENQYAATFIMALMAAAASVGQQMFINLTDEDTQYLYGICGLVLSPIIPTLVPSIDPILGRIIANNNPESSYYQQSDFTLNEVGHAYQLTLVLALGFMALNAIFFSQVRNILTLPMLDLGLGEASITTITKALPWLAFSALIGTKAEADLILFCQAQMYRRAELLTFITQVASVILTYAFLNEGLVGLAIGSFIGMLIPAIAAVAMQSFGMRDYGLFNLQPKAWGKQLKKFYDYSLLPLLLTGTLANVASIYSNVLGTINLQVVLAILTTLSSALAQIVIQVKGPSIEQQTGPARQKAVKEVLLLSTLPGMLIMVLGVALADQLKNFGGTNTQQLTTRDVQINTALGMSSQVASTLANTLSLVAIDKGNTKVPAAINGLSALIVILMCYFQPFTLGEDYKNAQGNVANLMGYGVALLAFAAYAAYQNYQRAAVPLASINGSAEPVAPSDAAVVPFLGAVAAKAELNSLQNFTNP